MKIAITGIQYHMEGTDREERKARAMAFVNSVKPGTKADLVAEPDNPADKDAVAVYIDCSRIGYVCAEEALQVKGTLDDFGTREIEIVDSDGHLTLFFEDNVKRDVGRVAMTQTRVLEPSPVDCCVLPLTKEDNELAVVMKHIMACDDVKRLIVLGEKFINDVKLSLGHATRTCEREVSDLLGKWLKKDGIIEEDRAKLANLHARVGEIIGDCHAEERHEKILTDLLDKLRKEAETKRGFFARYDEYYFDGPLESADKAQVKSEIKRLQEWLKKNMHCRKVTARNLVYRRLSKREMYDVMGVMLLLERMEKWLNGKKETKVIDEKPASQNATVVYPPIPNDWNRFFTKTRIVNGEYENMPVTEILHIIYNGTRDWDPNQTSSAHKWKMLYMLMKKYNLFLSEREQYKAFCDIVVKYVFPDLRGGYTQNIGKSKIDDNPDRWGKEDKKIVEGLTTGLENLLR